MERANVLLRGVRRDYFVLPVPLPLPSRGESGGLASERVPPVALLAQAVLAQNSSTERHKRG